MVEAENMSASDIAYRLAQIKDEIKDSKTKIEKHRNDIKYLNFFLLRLMREEVILKKAARDL